MENLQRAIQNAGFSEKAAQLYLHALEIGECTIQQLAKSTGIKRTTIYYILPELEHGGALIKTHRRKRDYYLAEEPAEVLRLARRRLAVLEDSLPALQERRLGRYKKPKILYFCGNEGFLQLWDKIFSANPKEYCIITEGIQFLDYMQETIIIKEVIKQKQLRNVRSRQIIPDSWYGRKIVAKDKTENRVSKLLPPGSKLPFTKIITTAAVAYVSPKWEDLLVLIENEDLAKTEQAMFDLLWNQLPSPEKEK